MPLTKNKINSILQISNKKQKKGVGGWEKTKKNKIEQVGKQKQEHENRFYTSTKNKSGFILWNMKQM